MKLFKFKSTKRIEELEKKIEDFLTAFKEFEEDASRTGEDLASRIEKLESEKAMARIAEVDKDLEDWKKASLISMEALEKLIRDADFEGDIKKLSERTGKNELMFTAVFKKAQDTFSRSMRALVTQTGRNNQFIMRLAGEKLEEIENRYKIGESAINEDKTDSET